MPHTPGPWQRQDSHTLEGRITIIANIDGEYFTDSPSPCMAYDTIAVCEDAYGERLDEAEDNARLITAAPELLAALTALESHARKLRTRLEQLKMRGQMDSFFSVALMNAKAAIAKATGQ